MSTQDFCFRLLCASFAGFLIGFERQWHHKAAGLRTNMLVAIGAALYVLLSVKVTQSQGDVTRIISQVVTGVGFLGAGIIFKEGMSVHGLTTAATLWCSAAIGCVSAAGYVAEAMIGTALILSINSLLSPIDKWLEMRSKTKTKSDQ